MYLHEVSGGSESTTMVVGEVRKNAPLIDRIHFFVENGGAASKRKDANTPDGGSFRAIGSDYTPKVGAPEYAAFALKIFGDTLRVDRAFEERGGDIPSEFKRQLKDFGRKLGKNLQKYLIIGDSTVSSLEFNGMKKTIAGMGATQTLDVLGENGLQVQMGNGNAEKKSQQQFVEALRVLIRSVDGGAESLTMNSLVWGRISTIARDHVHTTTDEFGRLVDHFDNVPIVHAGYALDGSEILPQTESLGTSNDCSSIYALRSEEAAYWSFMTTRVGLKVYDMKLVGNFYEQTVELQMDSGEPMNARSLAVMPGARL